MGYRKRIASNIDLQQMPQKKLEINLHMGFIVELFSEVLAFSQNLGFDSKTFVGPLTRLHKGTIFPKARG
jgi:hypothetical protein